MMQTDKFKPVGMVVAVVGSLVVAALAGGIYHVLWPQVPASFLFLLPLAIGAAVGGAARGLGQFVGHCRQPVVAIGVAVVAGAAAWGSAQGLDYFLFRQQSYAEMSAVMPQADRVAIEAAMDEQLRQEYGQGGWLGYLLRQSQIAPREISFSGRSARTQTITLQGTGWLVYRGVELLLIVYVAGLINRAYAQQPYCEACQMWRKHTVPLVGDLAAAPEAIAALQMRRMSDVAQALRGSAGPDFARLEMDYCPACFTDSPVRLVNVHGKSEQTSWSGVLEASATRQLLELSSGGQAPRLPTRLM